MTHDSNQYRLAVIEELKRNNFNEQIEYYRILALQRFTESQYNRALSYWLDMVTNTHCAEDVSIQESVEIIQEVFQKFMEESFSLSKES